MNNNERISYDLIHCCIDTKGHPHYTYTMKMKTGRPDYPVVQGARKP